MELPIRLSLRSCNHLLKGAALVLELCLVLRLGHLGRGADGFNIYHVGENDMLRTNFP